MKNIFRKLLWIVGIAIILTECDGSKTELISTIRIKEFPITIELSESDKIDNNITSFGITEIRVVDSLLIVSVTDNRGFWHFYSLPDCTLKDSIFDKGGGPGEFLYPVPCYMASIIKDTENKTTVAIPTIVNSKMIFLDLDRENSLSDDSPKDKRDEIEIPSISGTIATFMLDSNRILNFSIIPEEHRIQRDIINLSAGQQLGTTDIKAFEILNATRAAIGSQVSLISTQPAIKPDGTMVAEIPNYNNEIYVYNTIDGESLRLIYPQQKPSVRKAEKLMSENKIIFGGGYGYDEFFTLLRYKMLFDNEQEEYLDLISWDGIPLGSIKLKNSHIRRCDIDLNQGVLYCLDSQNDIIECFDISKFINEITSKVL